jgi:hypothetical protein
MWELGNVRMPACREAGGNVEIRKRENILRQLLYKMAGSWLKAFRKEE